MDKKGAVVVLVARACCLFKSVSLTLSINGSAQQTLILSTAAGPE